MRETTKVSQYSLLGQTTKVLNIYSSETTKILNIYSRETTKVLNTYLGETTKLLNTYLREATKALNTYLRETPKVLNCKRAARARGDHGAQKSQGCLSAEDFQGVEARKKIRRKKYFKTPLVFTMNIRGEPACPRRQANCIQQVILTLAHQKQKPNAFGKL